MYVYTKSTKTIKKQSNLSVEHKLLLYKTIMIQRTLKLKSQGQFQNRNVTNDIIPYNLEMKTKPMKKR